MSPSLSDKPKRFRWRIVLSTDQTALDERGIPEPKGSPGFPSRNPCVRPTSRVHRCASVVSNESFRSREHRFSSWGLTLTLPTPWTRTVPLQPFSLLNCGGKRWGCVARGWRCGAGVLTGFMLPTHVQYVGLLPAHKPLGARAPFLARRLGSRTGDRHCTAFGFG